MKVAIVLPYLKAGGTERQASYIANYLKNRGHIVTIVSIEKKGSFEDLFDTKVKYLDITFSKINFLKIIYFLTQYIKENEIDIILNRAWSAHIISGSVSLLTKIPLITFLSGAIKFQDINFVKRKIHNFYLKKVNKIVSVSNASKENCKRFFDVKDREIEVIHNGIDIKMIRKESFKKIEYVDSKKIKEDSIKIFFMGRLIHRKGLDLLLKAVSNIEVDNEIEVLVLGKGIKLEDYKKMSFDLGIEDEVEFLGQKTNPFPYLAKSDIFVLPSREEGFPNALLEGMALGKPVIAADCDNGPREIINGENGTLVPVDDSTAISEAISYYISNPKVAQLHGQNALITIENKFKLEIQLSKIEKKLKYYS